MRRSRLLNSGIMLISVLMLSVTGCARSVDYQTETENKEKNSVSSISEIKTENPWKENITVSAKDKTSTIYINANIVVPDCENMSVVEVEDVNINADYKKRFLDAYFSGSEYFYHDIEHYTADEINAAIENLQKVPKGISKEDFYTPEHEKEIAEYSDALANAADTHTAAKDLDICDVYAGYKGDVLCEVSFEKHNIYAYAWNLDDTYYGPPSLKDYDYEFLNPTFQEDDLKNGISGNENECLKSSADAKKEVSDFCGKLGMSNLIERGECDYNWIGFNNSDYGDDFHTAVWGYMYSYGTGVGKKAFKDCFQYYMDNIREEDSVQISVTDNGIIDVSLEYPVNVTSISNNVELLPLTNIEEILKAELNENTDKYDLSTNKSFNKLELSYCRIKDDKVSGKYSYVPAWSLSRLVDSEERNVIFVNAIDGTIIDTTGDGGQL